MPMNPEGLSGKWEKRKGGTGMRFRDSRGKIVKRGSKKFKAATRRAYETQTKRDFAQVANAKRQATRKRNQRRAQRAARGRRKAA